MPHPTCRNSWETFPWAFPIARITTNTANTQPFRSPCGQIRYPSLVNMNEISTSCSLWKPAKAGIISCNPENFPNFWKWTKKHLYADIAELEPCGSGSWCRYYGARWWGRFWTNRIGWRPQRVGLRTPRSLISELFSDFMIKSNTFIMAQQAKKCKKN